MDAPVEAVSVLTLLISGCTVLSGIFSARILNKLGTAKVTAFSTAMTEAALFGFSVAPSFRVMLLPLPGAVAVVGLFFVGLGNGSIYPNMIHLTPHNFGKEVSQSFMGSQIAFAYIGVMLAPPMVSIISKIFGIGVYPVLLAVIYVIMVIAIIFFINRLKKRAFYILSEPKEFRPDSMPTSLTPDYLSTEYAELCAYAI